MSLDGFLARADDTLDFFHTGEQEPRGFKEFLASVDVVVIGRRTFEIVLKLGHLALYGENPVVVLSSRRLDFSSIKGSEVEQMSGEPTEMLSSSNPTASSMLTSMVASPFKDFSLPDSSTDS